MAVDQTWTYLHAALGEPPGPVTSQLVQRAVLDRLDETEVFDWKRELPAAGGVKEDPKRYAKTLDRFLNVVCAMANSSGGLIVAGVGQNGDVPEVVGVELGADKSFEAQKIRIHRLLSASITPPVLGISILHVEMDTGETVVTLTVPQSVQSPHFVLQGEKFAAPIRVGPSMRTLSEREIDSFYRRRHSARQEVEDRLEKESAALRRHLVSEKLWLTAVAVPYQEVIPAGDAQIVDFRAGIQRVGERARDLYEVPGGADSDFAYTCSRLAVGLNPRVGLRRRILLDEFGARNEHGSHVRLELHEDGAIGFAFSPRLHSKGDPVQQTLDDWFSEGFCAALGSLLTNPIDGFSSSTYSVLIDLHRIEHGIEYRTHGQFTRASEKMAHFEPIRVSGPAGPTEASDPIKWVREIARDIANQFGVDELTLLRN